MNKSAIALLKLLFFLASAGTLAAQTVDTNGLTPFVDYHTNGLVHTQGMLRNGKKEGLWIENYPDGKKFREVIFKNGKLEGPYKVWFPNGKRSEGSFKNGKTHGLIRTWYANNQLEFEDEVVDDKSNGKYTAWFPNGHKRLEGQNANGHRVGRWIEWDNTGGRIADGTYDDNGIPIEGSVRVRDPRTHKYEEMKTFKNGIEVKP